MAGGQTRRRSAPERFGARVRDRREGLGWTQEKLAERAELHRTYVGRIERGERNLGLVNILRLAAALKVDAAELVKGLRAQAFARRPRDMSARLDASESVHDRVT